MAMFTAQEETVLLACATNYRDGSSLAWLHGFIFGYAIIPEQLKSNEWIPVGGFPKKMMGMFRKEEVESLARCIFSVYTRLARQNRENELEFPFDSDPVRTDDIPIIRLWAQGFYAAIMYFPAIWDASSMKKTEFCETGLLGNVDCQDTDIKSSITVISNVAFPERIAGLVTHYGDDADLHSWNDTAVLLGLLPNAVDAVRRYAKTAGEGRHTGS